MPAVDGPHDSYTYEAVVVWKGIVVSDGGMCDCVCCLNCVFGMSLQHLDVLLAFLLI